MPTQDKINASIDLATEMPDKFSSKEIEEIWGSLKKAKISDESKYILGQKYVESLPSLTKDKEYIHRVEQELQQNSTNALFVLKRKKRSR